VFLDPGQSKAVEFTVHARALSFYSDQRHDWTVEPGSFDLSAGSPSRDLRLTTKLQFER
jgi:beta-glucosidase